MPQNETDLRTKDVAAKNLMRSGDVISGIALTALGIFIIVQSHAWDYYTIDGPGPGLFPMWYGIAMVALSLLLIINKVRRPDTDAKTPTDWPAVGRALGTWAAFTVSVLLMAWVGFVVSFSLFSFLLVTLIFQRSALAAALTAIGVTTGFYAVFTLALGVQLPQGVFGF